MIIPTKVTSAGGRYAFKDDWQTPDTQVATFEFGNNKSITWEGRSCNKMNVEGASRGFIIYGDKGTLVNYGNDDYKIFDADNKLVKEIQSATKNDGTNTVSATGNLDLFHFKILLTVFVAMQKSIRRSMKDIKVFCFVILQILRNEPAAHCIAILKTAIY